MITDIQKEAVKQIAENPDAVDDLADVVGAIDASEARYVRAQLRRGRIDGMAYRARPGTCGCLLGAIATKRGIELPYGNSAQRNAILRLPTMPGPYHRPSEALFVSIFPGDRPSNSSDAHAVDELLTEIMLSNPKTFGRKP